MTKKSDPKTADQEEYQRFLETALQVGASEDTDAFDKAFDAVAVRSKRDGFVQVGNDAKRPKGVARATSNKS